MYTPRKSNVLIRCSSLRQKPPKKLGRPLSSNSTSPRRCLCHKKVQKQSRIVSSSSCGTLGDRRRPLRLLEGRRSAYVGVTEGELSYASKLIDKSMPIGYTHVTPVIYGSSGSGYQKAKKKTMLSSVSTLLDIFAIRLSTSFVRKLHCRFIILSAMTCMNLSETMPIIKSC